MLSRDDRRQPVAEAHASAVRSNATLEDATPVAAARLNRQAFRLPYERNLDQIYRYCLLKLGGREAAEDAASHVFMRAVARLETYNAGPFAGWLFRIAQRVVANFYRQPRRGLPGTLARGQTALPLEAAE
jgi:DNA-directed RNA polymerase specialized sigma24 family protein